MRVYPEPMSAAAIRSPGQNTNTVRSNPRPKGGQDENFDSSLSKSGRRRLQQQNGQALNADKERQSLQAYEYLCHVEEAKHWVEGILGEQLPDTVDFPKSLQDGVTLAKLTKKLRPDLVGRIFEHPRLQYRHIDNIVAFFNFVQELRVPDLFTFELIDLYELKNLPKVIYCLHAISHMLAETNEAPDISDLVGQLEFTQEELDVTQKGLDSVAGGIPKFSQKDPKPKQWKQPEPEPLPKPEPLKMRKPIPEPELIPEPSQSLSQKPNNAQTEILPPTETETTAPIQTEFAAYETSPSTIPVPAPVDYNSQLYKSKYIPENEWESPLRPEELMLIMLEAAESEIIEFQAACRGSLARTKKSGKITGTQLPMLVLQIQSAYRAGTIRKTYRGLEVCLKQHNEELVNFQSICRHKLLDDSQSLLRDSLDLAELDLVRFQAASRRFIIQQRLSSSLNGPTEIPSQLSAACRAFLSRTTVKLARDRVKEQEKDLTTLQSIIRGFMARKSHPKARLANTKYEDNFSAIAAGSVVRSRLHTLRSNLELHSKDIVAVQSHFRGVILRFRLSCFFEDIEEQVLGVIGLQSQTRRYLQTIRLSKIRNSWSMYEPVIVRIQALRRGLCQSRAYDAVLHEKVPKIPYLRRFLHLCQLSDSNTQILKDLQKVRSNVNEKLSKIQLMETCLERQSAKLDFLSSCTKSFENGGSEMGGFEVKSTGHKNSSTLFAQSKLYSSYRKLFYCLQSDPRIFTALVRNLQTSETVSSSWKRATHLVQQSFGNVESKREQYLFTKLLLSCLTSDVSRSSSLTEFQRKPHMAEHLIQPLNMVLSGRDYFPGMAQQCLERMLSQSTDLEIDPLKIWRGQNGNNANVTVDVAIQDPQTRSIFVNNLQQLREMCMLILEYVMRNASKLPSHVRLAAKVMYEASYSWPSNTQGHLGDAHEHQRLALIGYCVFELYINSALRDPASRGLIQNQLGINQIQALSLVSKVLYQAATFGQFGPDDVYLQPLNDSLASMQPKLCTFYRQILDIGSIDSQFQMTAMDDFVSIQNPTLKITYGEILEVCKLLAQHRKAILDELKAPLFESLTRAIDDADDFLTSQLPQNTDLHLILLPNQISQESQKSDLAGDVLWLKAKRYLTYVILIQDGEDLMEILVKPVTQDDEIEFYKLVSSQRPISKDLTKMNFRDLKALALEKFLELESIGRLSRQNGYQDIIESMRNDVLMLRTKQDSDNELHSLELADQALQKKQEVLAQNTAKCEKGIKAIERTLDQHCLNRKKQPTSFRKKLFSHKEESFKSARFGFVKLPGDRAMECGVLKYVKGFTGRQLKDITLAISSNSLLSFEIEVFCKGTVLPGGTITYTLDDLISEKLKNSQRLVFSNGDICLDINETLSQISSMLQQ